MTWRTRARKHKGYFVGDIALAMLHVNPASIKLSISSTPVPVDMLLGDVLELEGICIWFEEARDSRGKRMVCLCIDAPDMEIRPWPKN